MSTTQPDPNATPEPVTTAEWWKATVLALLLATIGVLGALDVWHPTEGQVAAFSTAAAVLVATIFPLIAFYVRKQVTPNSKVALTYADVALLDGPDSGNRRPTRGSTSRPHRSTRPARQPGQRTSARSDAPRPAFCRTRRWSSRRRTPDGASWAIGEPTCPPSLRRKSHPRRSLLPESQSPRGHSQVKITSGRLITSPNRCCACTRRCLGLRAAPLTATLQGTRTGASPPTRCHHAARARSWRRGSSIKCCDHPATRWTSTHAAYMEPRFGHDFSHVRVHTDERAAAVGESTERRGVHGRVPCRVRTRSVLTTNDRWAAAARP